MADGSKGLKLYNTLTRAKEEFAPIDPANVRMYVCGPTVYDYAHIGNARPAIVFDVLFRLLRHLYGPEHVTYVRNITDVDDKINARALRDYGEEIAAGRQTLNEAIRKVTEPTYDQYQKDVTALGCLEPTYQPRATEFVLPRPDGKTDMVALIQSLIDRGHAYHARGEGGAEILFDTSSMPDYGQLSKRNLDEQQAGARVAVEAHKKHPADFVLWKESSAEEPGWEATFTVDGKPAPIRGRPGWHIECSAMSEAYLGKVFDIHGGGLDLIFPHHENEIAQSRCAHGTDVMAKLWMHNGFLQVEGRKMSKSEGNFVTIRENLRGKFPGWNGGPWHGLVLRCAMLMTHYRQPIDWKLDRLLEARSRVSTWNLFVGNWAADNFSFEQHGFGHVTAKPFDEIVELLSDDLNTPAALTRLSEFIERRWFKEKIGEFIASLRMLGLLTETSLAANSTVTAGPVLKEADNIRAYSIAHDFGIAIANDDEVQKDSIRQELRQLGWSVAWSPPRYVDLKPLDASQALDVEKVVQERLAFIHEKNWAEADRIRDELLAQGIQLKDGKDPATGERVTTWEVKR